MHKHLKTLVVPMLILFISVSVLFCTSAESEMDRPILEMHMIDVGQGDSTLIFNDKHAMLIDGGDADHGQIVCDYLNQHNISHLDFVVATHAHEDHIGGLIDILDTINVDTVLSPVSDFNSSTFQSFKASVERQNLDITVPDVGQTLTMGSVSFRILGPISSSDRINNNSLVLQSKRKT